MGTARPAQPARANVPFQGIDPTLEAAQHIIWQATANAQATRAAYEAQAAAQRATVAAISIQQTREVIEATRSAQATAQVISAQATRQAMDVQVTATRQALDAQAAMFAVSADSTRAAATATAVRMETQALVERQALDRQERQERQDENVRTAGWILILIIGPILAVLAGRGLWRIQHPIQIVQTDDVYAQVETDADAPGAERVAAPYIPPTRVVCDEESIRTISELLRNKENQ